MNEIWREEDTEASIPELLEHLSKLLVRLDYDLREFQRVLLNLNIFENQALDQELEPLAHYCVRLCKECPLSNYWILYSPCWSLKLIIGAKGRVGFSSEQKSKLRKVPSQSGRNVF